MFTEEHEKQNFNEWLAVFYIFLFLLSILLLTYTGVPISDDEHLFAAVSQNLVIDGEFRADQLLGNQRILGRYSNVGPIHPIIGSIVYRLVQWTNKIGGVQVLYFLPPFYTALTGALIFGYGVLRGYSRQVGLITALAFGLSTIAWPYSQTFYREPLAMLLFFSSFYIFTALLEEKIAVKFQVPGWFLAGGLYLFSTLAKIYLVSLIPLFVIRIWIKRKNNFRIKSKVIIRFITILLVVVVVIGIGVQVLHLDQFSRFSSLFNAISFKRIPDNYLRLFSFETITHFISVLISPAKGLFIYSPVLILSLLTLSDKKFRTRENALIPVGALVIFVTIQIFFYHDKWWNISWSTRFLLPIIPVLITAGYPIVQSALASKNTFIRGLLFAALALGFVVQIGGTAVSDSVYLEYLYTQKNVGDVSETIWNFQLMPAVQHWKLLFSGQEPQYAAVRNFLLSPFFISVIILILISLISWSGRYLYRLFHDRKREVWHPPKKQACLIILYILILMPILLVIAYRRDPIYSPMFRNLDAAVVYISKETDKDDLIVVDGYQKPAWYHMMNYGRPPTPWYALPEDTENWRSAVERIFQLKQSTSTIWILLEDDQTGKQNMIKYLLNGFGFTCNDVPLNRDSSDSYYRILNCESDLD